LDGDLIHGGIIRSRATRDFLNRSGFKTQTLSISFAEENSLGKNQIFLDREIKSNNEPIPSIFQDLELSLEAGQISKELLNEKLGSLEFEAIIFEQCWLFRPLHAYLSTRYPGAKLIYNSQNIELELKSELCKQMKSEVNEIYQAALLSEVDKIERYAISNADLSIATTEADEVKIKKLGARLTSVAGNGSDFGLQPHANAQGEQTPFAIFVASGHPPNWQGFLECIGTNLNFLAPNFRLVLVGDVCHSAREEMQRISDPSTFLEKAVLLDQVDESTLHHLLSTASIVTLPITTGGGSNLKTPEAIRTGKRIIATKTAMRGFEGWTNSPGVEVVDNPQNFRAALAKASSSTEHTYFERLDGRPYSLTWNDQLMAIKMNLLEILSK
jgi:hypothetical protein